MLVFHTWACLLGRSEHVKNDFLTPFWVKIHVSIIWHWGKCLKTRNLNHLRFRKRIWKNMIFRQIWLYKMPKYSAQNPNISKKNHKPDRHAECPNKLIRCLKFAFFQMRFRNLGWLGLLVLRRLPRCRAVDTWIFLQSGVKQSGRWRGCAPGGAGAPRSGARLHS